MSKLTYTPDDISKEIEYQTGIKVTYQSKLLLGFIIFKNTKTDESVKVTTSGWMRYQNKYSGHGIATHEFMNMNLLFTQYVMECLEIDWNKNPKKSKEN